MCLALLRIILRSQSALTDLLLTTASTNTTVVFFAGFSFLSRVCLILVVVFRLVLLGGQITALYTDIPNLKERPWTRFETVPSQGQGSLIVKHDLSLDRMFQNSRDLRPGDIKPGEKFRVRLNPKRLDFISWWTFGNLNGNLKEKKFAKWQLPDKTGLLDDLMLGEKELDVNRMLNEGWVFSQRRDELKVTESAENDNVIFEFIE